MSRDPRIDAYIAKAQPLAEAKQEATRQKRIATAVEWLSEGKRRHWKYENC